MKAGWTREKLGDACELIARGIAPKYIDSGGIRVVNQKCIRDHKIDFSLARRNDLGSKKVPEARIVRIGDVLINSTGTGTLGRVAQVRSNPDEPTTVDTHVSIVRSKAERFIPDFFGYMLVNIEDDFIAGGLGASGQTELSRADLETKFDVCYPTSLEEQQRIVAVLDEAFESLARARAHAEANLQNAQELFSASLRSLFSDNRENWPLRNIADVCAEFGRGKSRHRPRNDPRLYGGCMPFVQTGDLSQADHFLRNFTQTYSTEGVEQSRVWPKGTVCVAIVGATIGESAILEFEACFPDSVIGMVPAPGKADPEFLDFLLQFVKADLKEAGKGSARDNINLGTFSNRLFPIPDFNSQLKAIEKISEIDIKSRRIRLEYAAKLRDFEELRQSILQKAFAGELT